MEHLKGIEEDTVHVHVVKVTGYSFDYYPLDKINTFSEHLRYSVVCQTSYVSNKWYQFNVLCFIVSNKN